MKITSRDRTRAEFLNVSTPIANRYDSEMANGNQMAKAIETLIAAGLGEQELAALKVVIESAHYCGKNFG